LPNRAAHCTANYESQIKRDISDWVNHAVSCGEIGSGSVPAKFSTNMSALCGICFNMHLSKRGHGVSQIFDLIKGHIGDYEV
jgi:hypothetical protein